MAPARIAVHFGLQMDAEAQGNAVKLYTLDVRRWLPLAQSLAKHPTLNSRHSTLAGDHDDGCLKRCVHPKALSATVNHVQN